MLRILCNGVILSGIRIVGILAYYDSLTGINVSYDPGYINQLAIISIIVPCIYPSAFLLCHIRTSNLGDTKYNRGCV